MYALTFYVALLTVISLLALAFLVAGPLENGAGEPPMNKEQAQRSPH
jgi:hypothetical protein